MIRQGTFSYLPPFTDADIEAQLTYALGRGWSVSIEHTSDPHPGSPYWALWGLPLFDLTDPGPALAALTDCRSAHPDQYIRLSVFDAGRGRETTALSIIVQRPRQEVAYRVTRQRGPGRTTRYELVESAVPPVGIEVS